MVDEPEGFAELMRILGVERHSHDLEDYDHTVQITDDRALLAETALRQKRKEAANARHLVRTLEAEAAAIEGRLLMRLAEVYPEVGASRGGHGIVVSGGKSYYVGEDG